MYSHSREVKGYQASDAVSHAFRGRSLDAIVAVLSAMMVFGVALDFKAHSSGITFEEEGFLTPEHTFFYTVFLGIVAVIGIAVIKKKSSVARWSDAIPAGYATAIVGSILFAVGGLADLYWHSIFGFEEGIESLTSPSHLLLAVGAGMFLASPLKAASIRRDRSGKWRNIFPSLISMSLVLTVIVFFLGYINPVMSPRAHYMVTQSPSDPSMSLGAVGLFVFPVILLGGALFLINRFELPFGSLVFVFAVPALFSSVINDHHFLVLPVLVSGMIGDVLIRAKHPFASTLRLRSFGVIVPASFTLVYCLLVEMVWGIEWTVHVWTGTVVLAALAGLLLTYMFSPSFEVER